VSYRLAHVYVDTGSESVDIFGGPIKALRRVNHVAAINTCSAITTLTCSSSKLGQINASLSTPIGEVGQEVEIWIETEGGVTLPVFLRARISAITSDGPFTVIEAEPECSILQSYTAGARDADGTSYSGEVTVCSVMREIATIRLGEVSDPSTHIDREYGVVVDSTGTVMGSTSSWTYPTPPATRADLLMRLSRLSAWPNLEDQTVQPMVFYPHHGGRTLTITRYGNGYYDEVAPVETISKSEGHVIGRIEHTPEDVDNITNKAFIQFQDRNRLNLVFPASIDKYGAREERINAKELEVTEDIIRLAQGITYLHGLPSSAISLTARYDRIVSDVHRGVLNRTYRVIDRQAGEDVDLGEHVVVRYELDMPSFRVHLRLRKRGWTEDDLSGLLAGTGRRIDKLEKASLDTSSLANVTAAREASTREAVESLSEYVSDSVVPAHNSLVDDVSSLRSAHNSLVENVSGLATSHNSLANDVSNLTSAHNSLVDDVSSLRSAHDSLSEYVSGTVVPSHNALANDVSNLTSAHNTLVENVSSLESAHNTLVEAVEEELSSLRSAHDSLLGDVTNLATSHNTLQSVVHDGLVPAYNSLLGDVSNLASAHNTLVDFVEEDIEPRVANNETGILGLYNSALLVSEGSHGRTGSYLKLTNGMILCWFKALLDVPAGSDHIFTVTLPFSLLIYGVNLSGQAFDAGWAPSFLWHGSPDVDSVRTSQINIKVARTSGAPAQRFKVHIWIIGAP